ISRIDTKYLYYLLLNSKDEQSANATGAIFRNLTTEQVRAIEIPLPQTIEEQKRIAAILDEQMKTVEQARAAVEEQLKAAHLLTNALLRSVFESEEAQKWERKKLGELSSKIGSGITPAGGQSSYKKTGIALIRSQNVHFNKFSYNGLAFISDEQDS